MKVNFVTEGLGWARDIIYERMKGELKKHGIQCTLNGDNDTSDIVFCMFLKKLNKWYIEKTIVFLDSFRTFSIDLEKELQEVIKEINSEVDMKAIKLSHIKYPFQWSWGLTSELLFELLKKKYNVYTTNHNIISDLSSKNDLIFVQTLSLLNKLYCNLNKDLILKKLILRLGGNKLINQRISDDQIEILSNCAWIIATNKKLYMFAKRFNNRVSLIPNGLDLNYWYPIKSDEDFLKENLVVGFAGNVSSFYYRNYKGIDFVRKAVEKNKMKLELALFGSSQIPWSRMKEDFYSKIHVFALPTLGEGCSNVISESLACGIPVLTTRFAGFHAEFCKDSKEIFFIERDILDIAEKLRFLSENRELLIRSRIAGRRFIEKYQDIRHIAKRYYKVFLRALKYKGK